MDIKFIIIFIAIVYILYDLYDLKNNLTKENQSLKNQLNDFESRYDGDMDKLSQIITSINEDMPKVSHTLDLKISALLNEKRKEFNDYVISCFKNVNKDIMFEAIIDEHTSKNISLKSIMKQQKDKYSELFGTVISNFQTATFIINNGNSDIKKFKGDIIGKIEEMTNEAKKYNDNYTKGKEKANSILKRLDALEKQQIESLNSQDSSSDSSDSDTFDDTEFEILKEDLEECSILSLDEPKEDPTYLRYKNM